jgi:hypothetical protein
MVVIPVALDKTLGALLAMAGARQRGYFHLYQTLGGESFIATAFAQDDAEAARLQWFNRGTTDDLVAIVEQA